MSINISKLPLYLSYIGHRAIYANRGDRPEPLQNHFPPYYISNIVFDNLHLFIYIFFFISKKIILGPENLIKIIKIEFNFIK